MDPSRVADELAIRRLLAVYCHYCDDGRFSELTNLFTPEASFVHGTTTATGHTALRAFFEERQGQPEQRGRHLTANTVLDIHAAGARALSDFVYLKSVEGIVTIARAGRYRDDFVRTPDGQWRFARREVEIW